jgi:MFS family permease
MSESCQHFVIGPDTLGLMTDRFTSDTLRRRGLYHGWLVVLAAFLVAMFGFGLGFYGPGVYLVGLKADHGWSVAELVPAITAYYILGALLLFFCVGPLFEKCGTRMVVIAGAVAMAAGIVLLTMVSRRWQVYAAFAVMALGWAAMSGAAINIIVAPWFDKRRGLAVSWSMNGANAGGIVVIPLLTLSIAHLGFEVSLRVAAAAMVAILVPIATMVFRPRRRDECDRADRGEHARQSRPAGNVRQSAEPSWVLWSVVRSGRFQTISIPFALALMAQVGVLTHQLACLSPILGTLAAGWAVSVTAFAAVAGRTLTGFFVDRIDRRITACGNFLVQIAGVAVLASSSTAPMLYLGCVLFGLGVGNTTSLPSLIVQQEFPSRFFTRIVSLVVAINQFTFAFGPSLLGYLRQHTGSYAVPLIACIVIEAVAAFVVVLPVLARSKQRRLFSLSRHSRF